MSGRTEVLDQVMQQDLEPQARLMGLKPVRRRWYRQIEGDICRSVAVVESLIPGTNSLWFTLSASVGYRSLATDAQPFLGLKEEDVRFPGTIGVDLGHLMPEHNFHKWSVSDETDTMEQAVRRRCPIVF